VTSWARPGDLEAHSSAAAGLGRLPIRSRPVATARRQRLSPLVAFVRLLNQPARPQPRRAAVDELRTYLAANHDRHRARRGHGDRVQRDSLRLAGRSHRRRAVGVRMARTAMPRPHHAASTRHRRSQEESHMTHPLDERTEANRARPAAVTRSAQAHTALARNWFAASSSASARPWRLGPAATARSVPPPGFGSRCTPVLGPTGLTCGCESACIAGVRRSPIPAASASRPTPPSGSASRCTGGRS
jgi:hypothetical protein